MVLGLAESLYERTPPIPPEDYVRIDAAKLRELVISVFQVLEVDRGDAEIVADVLVTADLFGIESHGVQRLRRYVNGLKNGSINPKPNIKVVKEGPSYAIVDGDNGLGHVVAYRAMNIAIDKAKKSGLGLSLIHI